MRHVSIRLLLISIVAVAFSASALAQVGVIRGVVTDLEDNPLKDVQIEIQSMGIKRTLTTKTDKNGRFLHAGVPRSGQYRVIARLEGYTPDFVEGIRPGFNMDDEERGLVNFQLKPGNAEAAMAFELTEDERKALMEQAEEAEEKAAEMEASAAAFQQAITDYEAGNYEAARDGFLKTTEVRGDEAVVWANLGNAYNRLEQYDQALDAYNKAILLDSSQHAFFQNRAGIHSSMGNADAAQADYDKAASMASALDPSAAAMNYFNMAVPYLNSQEFDKAIPHLTKALELDPSNGEARYQLAICKLNLGDMEGSVAELKKYLEVAPNGKYAEDAKAMIDALSGGS